VEELLPPLLHVMQGSPFWGALTQLMLYCEQTALPLAVSQALEGQNDDGSTQSMHADADKLFTHTLPSKR
jgi:hypothetical protein